MNYVMAKPKTESGKRISAIFSPSSAARFSISLVHLGDIVTALIVAKKT